MKIKIEIEENMTEDEKEIIEDILFLAKKIFRLFKHSNKPSSGDKENSDVHAT